MVVFQSFWKYVAIFIAELVVAAWEEEVQISDNAQGLTINPHVSGDSNGFKRDLKKDSQGIVMVISVIGAPVGPIGPPMGPRVDSPPIYFFEKKKKLKFRWRTMIKKFDFFFKNAFFLYFWVKKVKKSIFLKKA